MAKLKVATNQNIKKGDVVGYVSNDFGGTPTTLHLHFEIKLNTAENGWQYAPPYSSLLAAYQRRLLRKVLPGCLCGVVTSAVSVVRTKPSRNKAGESHGRLRPPAGSMGVTAQIRYNMREQPGTLTRSEADLDSFCVKFESAVRAPTPGQALVCYEGDRVVGGGVIIRSP